MHLKKWLLAVAIALGTFVAHMPAAFAQVSEEDFEVDLIETEIKKNAPQKRTERSAPSSEEQVDALSDLTTLVPFSDVAVLQKRYLPKTKRFQFFGGLTSMVNDPWFLGMGLNGRVAYHFNESMGVEGSFLFLNTSQRQAAKDLYSEHGVSTTSLITTKSYYGLDFVWTPIYGKMGLFNQKIIPFDMYFTVGAGTTGVDNGEGGATFHAGTGQIFALSKSMGFRWDFSWNSYQGTPTGRATQAFNNLMLTFGVSFFYPEVSQR